MRIRQQIPENTHSGLISLYSHPVLEEFTEGAAGSLNSLNSSHSCEGWPQSATLYRCLKTTTSGSTVNGPVCSFFSHPYRLMIISLEHELDTHAERCAREPRIATLYAKTGTLRRPESKIHKTILQEMLQIY